MRLFILSILLLCFGTTQAQKKLTTEQQIIQLSKDKWQWMADKDLAKLEPLFHEDSRFVHMSGTWGKIKELDIIKTGSIWYKHAEIHDVLLKSFGKNTYIVWNRITLTANVRGEDVTTQFTVTEVYQKKGKNIVLLDLTFSSVRDTHALEH
jgi:Domain of unknown function (DUF4440)